MKGPRGESCGTCYYLEQPARVLHNAKPANQLPVCRYNPPTAFAVQTAAGGGIVSGCTPVDPVDDWCAFHVAALAVQ